MRKRATCNRYTLSLHQRAQAIREYNSLERKPSMQSFARKYNVSSPQMKSILLKSEHILNSYEEKFDGKQQQSKIQFLGRVMHEYMYRAMQQSIPIDDEQMRQKAMEVADRMWLGNFEITHSWLNDLKKSLDIKTLVRHPTLVQTKRTELTAFELIAFVSSTEVLSVNKSVVYRGNKVASKGYKSKGAVSSRPSSNRLPANVNSPVVVNEPIIENDFEEKPTIINMASCCFQEEESQSKSEKNSFNVSSDISTLEIKTEDEVLKHLRHLEEYAMLQDNYRAIGLITQLENVFKESTKTRQN